MFINVQFLTINKKEIKDIKCCWYIDHFIPVSYKNAVPVFLFSLLP
jgi:hypothetical protein